MIFLLFFYEHLLTHESPFLLIFIDPIQRWFEWQNIMNDYEPGQKTEKKRNYEAGQGELMPTVNIVSD